MISKQVALVVGGGAHLLDLVPVVEVVTLGGTGGKAAKLCSFIAKLADEHLKHWTIKLYLAAVRLLQFSERLPDSFHGQYRHAQIAIHACMCCGALKRTSQT